MAAKKTFGALRLAVLEQAKAANLFAYRRTSLAHDTFWEEMNALEYERGYTPSYSKPGTPALCDMPLLEADEFTALLERAPK